MYHDKEKLATKLYEIMDDLMLTDDDKSVSIDKLLNPAQKYSLIMSIINGLPDSDFESVLKFNNKFKLPKETTPIFNNFEHKRHRYNLILEELLELGFSLGFTDWEVYVYFTEQYRAVKQKNITGGLTNTLDALTDILFVTYGAFYTFNLENIQYDALQEVYQSNLTKLIPNNESGMVVIKELINRLKEKNQEGRTVDLKNEYLKIINTKTEKIEKPITYIEPDLKTIINKHLKD